MNKKEIEIGWKKYFCERPDSPCYECLIKSICNISFEDKSACEKLIKFINKKIRRIE